MTKFAKEMLGKFDEYRFYVSENMDYEAMVIPQFYREDGLTPVFVIFKDGIREEKYVSVSFIEQSDLFFLFFLNSKQTKQHEHSRSPINNILFFVFFMLCHRYLNESQHLFFFILLLDDGKRKRKKDTKEHSYFI